MLPTLAEPTCLIVRAAACARGRKAGDRLPRRLG